LTKTLASMPTPSEGVVPSMQVELVRIRKNAEHAFMLYNLLKTRVHNISHVRLPTLEEHFNFVMSHPYRAWYFIKAKNDGSMVGSIYLHKNNCIGISVLPGCDDFIEDAIAQLISKFSPLPAIKSVRTAVFAFNVAPENNELMAVIKKMGARLVQHTFVLNN
jgi:hypothetical protein